MRVTLGVQFPWTPRGGAARAARSATTHHNPGGKPHGVQRHSWSNMSGRGKGGKVAGKSKSRSSSAASSQLLRNWIRPGVSPAYMVSARGYTYERRLDGLPLLQG